MNYQVEEFNEVVKWQYQDEDFYEGNVQNKIINYLMEFELIQKQYIKSADTTTKARGKDIEVNQNSQRILIIEVKGYPSDKYCSGSNQGKPKKTNPRTQAVHWFSSLLSQVIKHRCDNPNSNVKVAMGLPEYKYYTDQINSLSYFRKTFNIGCYIAKKDGSVVYIAPNEDA